MREKLKDYRRLMDEIDYLECKLLEVETKATRMSPVLSDDIRGNYKEPDKITDLVAAMIEYKDKINVKLKLAYQYKSYVEDKISSLPNKEQHIMRLRYIEGKSLEFIAVEMHYSWRHVKRLHNLGLAKLDTKELNEMGFCT